MIRKTIKAIGLGLILSCLPATVFAADLPDRTEYEGQFTDVIATDDVCSGLFAPAEYQVKHFRVGPTRRTSVMHLTSNEDGAFFHRKSFYGLLGGSNDLYYEEQMVRDGNVFKILAEGFIGRAVVYLEFSVVGKDDTGRTICEATANFAAYN